MDTLSFEAMKIDLTLKKHLASLIALKEKIEAALKNPDDLSPLEEIDLKNSLQKVDETIGKIRFHALDGIGAFTNNKNQYQPEEESSGQSSGEPEPIQKPPELVQKQAPGMFSPEQQQTAELSNQAGRPVKQKGGEDVTQNKEPYYKAEPGFDPEEDDDSFYKSFDDILDLQKMAELIGPEQSLPRGTKQLAKESEYEIYHGLRKAVNTWFDGIMKDTMPLTAAANLKMSLLKWNSEAKSASSESVQELYSRGVESGLRKAGVLPPKHIKIVKYMIHKANSIGPALDKFKDDCYNNIERIMKRHIHDGEHALYREKREIDSWLRKQRYQTRMMVKTEVAKIANFGLIEAWSYDEEKYNHNYFWNAIVDERTKEISRIRKSGNPYTFDEIQWLWKNQEQLIENRWENDSYNQRCHISRERIDKEHTGNRFEGRELEFNQTM